MFKKTKTLKTGVFTMLDYGIQVQDISPELAREVERRGIRRDPEYQRLIAECKKCIGDIIAHYWEMGRHIANFMDPRTRAERYGTGLYKIIAEDLGVDEATVYQARKFYLCLPERAMVTRFAELPWSRARRLLPLLEDAEVRILIIKDIPKIRAMTPARFTEWYNDATEEHLGHSVETRSPRSLAEQSAPSIPAPAPESKSNPRIEEVNTPAPPILRIVPTRPTHTNPPITTEQPRTAAPRAPAPSVPERPTPTSVASPPAIPPAPRRRPTIEESLRGELAHYDNVIRALRDQIRRLEHERDEWKNRYHKAQAEIRDLRRRRSA